MAKKSAKPTHKKPVTKKPAVKNAAGKEPVKPVKKSQSVIKPQAKSKRSTTTKKKPKKSSVLMWLARIRNKLLFDSPKPEESHTYLIYEDTNTGEKRAIQTTHLYNVDEKNMTKVKKGLLKKVKFNEFETPSGVNNYYYSTDKSGNPLELKNMEIINKNPVSENEAAEIRDFAKRRRENKTKEKP